MKRFDLTRLPPAVATGALLVLLFIPPALKAEPFIAVRTGFKCSQCHVNLTGGGKRTDFGNIYVQRFLSRTFVSSTEETTFSPRLTDSFSVGGNLRVRETRTLSHSDQAETAPASSFLDMTEGNLYLEARVIPRVLTFYVDQAVGPEPGSREVFGLLQGLPGGVYLKAGKMLLPYGFRLWDDAAFIREATGFTYSGPELAAEIGLEPANFSISSAVNSDQVSGVASWVRRHGRVGVSWQQSLNDADTRTLGGFAGGHAGRLTFLGEMDQLKFGDRTQYAYLAEVDVLMIRGHNLKLSYHLFDRNDDVALARDGQERYTIGWEAFPIQFVQLSAFYSANSFVPRNLVLNQDTVVGELHFFF